MVGVEALDREGMMILMMMSSKGRGEHCDRPSVSSIEFRWYPRRRTMRPKHAKTHKTQPATQRRESSFLIFIFY